MDTRTQAIMQMLINQRNNALDTVATLAGEIAALQEELEKKGKEEKQGDENAN